METASKDRRLEYGLIKMSSNLVHHVTSKNVKFASTSIFILSSFAKCDLGREVFIKNSFTACCTPTLCYWYLLMEESGSQ